ncbi:MAG: valine--tRNA ligase, partial [Actinomycetaceae bacterium]
PTGDELRAAAGDADGALVDAAGRALAALRKVKSEAKVSQKVPYASVTLGVPTADVGFVRSVASDLRHAAKVRGELTITDGAEATTVTDHVLDPAA